MNKMKMILSTTLALSVLASVGTAAADGDKRGGPGDRRPSAAAAPELAGKGAPAALALVAGGIAIVAARRRRTT